MRRGNTTQKLMDESSNSLRGIESYFEDFCLSIERCRTASVFHAADWQDAYTRLARLRERYKADEGGLLPFERKALSKVFEHDPFTQGMMQIRQVAEHIHRNDTFTVRTPGNAPVVLDTDSSAKAVFSSSTPTLIDTAGQPHRLDHLQMLQEMERRMAKAIAKAHEL